MVITMQRVLRGLVALAFCIAATASHAFDAPLVRVERTPAADVFVGQPVMIDVTVLMPPDHVGDIQWPALTMADAVVERLAPRPASAADRASWRGHTGRYVVTPLRSGRVDAAFPALSVNYPAPNAATYSVGATDELAPPRVEFEARAAPPGAVGAYFLPTTALSLTETYDDAGKALKVGDALRRTVTTRITGVPAMLLPTPDLKAAEGVATYADRPRLGQEPQADAPSDGQRVDFVTYALEREGTWTLPGVRIAWWDLASGTPRETTLPARTIQVAAGPAGDRTDLARWMTNHWPWLLAAVFVMIGGLWLGRRLRAAGAPSRSLRRRPWDDGPGLLLRLRFARTPAEFAALLHRWERSTGRFGRHAAREGSAREALYREVYGRPGEPQPAVERAAIIAEAREWTRRRGKRARDEMPRL